MLDQVPGCVARPVNRATLSVLLPTLPSSRLRCAHNMSCGPMPCCGMVATGRSQIPSQPLSCSNINGTHAVRLIHGRLAPPLRAHRPVKFALLCLSAAKSPPTGERSTKVVGLGSVGLDYLAQVVTFPKPDEKLRTKQMEVRHSKFCRGTRFVGVFKA